MLYIHQTASFSAQQTYPDTAVGLVQESADNQLRVREPVYPDIPAGALRRMGKAVRMSLGAALPILKTSATPDGIIVGTANGGMEDCIKFLNQIIEYKEGLLTPGNFVQSTANAPAAQMAMISKNKKYNCTHTHRGLAFENALLDAMMQVAERPAGYYLVGSVEEISAYNFNIDRLAGCYRETIVSNKKLFVDEADGTIAGEGALMMTVSGQSQEAIASLDALQTIHSTDQQLVMQSLRDFLRKNGFENNFPDLLITGENGDQRYQPFYEAALSLMPEGTAIARFKHLSGEYCTASSFGCWLATEILRTKTIPEAVLKRKGQENISSILLYNNYRGLQHAFMLFNPVK